MLDPIGQLGADDWSAILAVGLLVACVALLRALCKWAMKDWDGDE